MKPRSGLGQIVCIVVVVLGAIAFVWLVLLRLISKLGHRGPCPYALAWTVDNPLRRRYWRDLMAHIGVRAGERVLELGPGPGAFTLQAAGLVGPHGRVVAVDIQPAMIAALEKKLAGAGVTNVETHVASAYDLPLEAGSVDRAFLVTVLAEIPDQPRALAELYRVLKPGGILSVSEEFLDPDYPLARTIIPRVQAAGFELAGRHGNWWTYTLNFRRLASRAEIGSGR
jgi:SAM-dependent methyltransferase